MIFYGYSTCVIMLCLHVIIQHLISLGTVAENSPIIPISAQLRYNIDVICEFIITSIPIPVRDFTSSPRYYECSYLQHRYRVDP